jgi:hypothetical protein
MEQGPTFTPHPDDARLYKSTQESLNENEQVRLEVEKELSEIESMLVQEENDRAYFADLVTQDEDYVEFMTGEEKKEYEETKAILQSIDANISFWSEQKKVLNSQFSETVLDAVKIKLFLQELSSSMELFRANLLKCPPQQNN